MPIDPKSFEFLLDYLKSNNINPNSMNAGNPTTHEMMDVSNIIQQGILNSPNRNTSQNKVPEQGIGFVEFANANGIPLDENTPDKNRRWDIVNETKSYDTGYPKRSPKTIEDLVSEGYSVEEANQLQNSENNVLFNNYSTPPEEGINTDVSGGGTSSLSELLRVGLPYTSAVGTDLDTNAYDIGRYLGMEKGTKGKGLGVAASIGDFLLGSARGITSGLGFEKRNAYVEDWYRQQQNRRQYTPNSQTQSTNNVGGQSYGAYGGMVEDLPNNPNDTENSDGTEENKTRKPFFKKYGDISWEDYWDEKNQEGSGIDVYDRSKKEARQLARKVNSRIKDGEIIDGVDYSQFQKVKPKQFISEAEDLPAFSNGGLFKVQNPDEGQTITFMYGGKKYQGIISSKDKKMFK